MASLLLKAFMTKLIFAGISSSTVKFCKQEGGPSSISAVYHKKSSPRLRPWMKEEKGIRHRGKGAFLRCPVSTAVQFSLRDEGSSEYICVCEGRESLRPNF